IKYCNLKGIKFLSTAFDLETIDLLKTYGITLYKVPSGEITNLPYLRKIASVADEIVLSTGMCEMIEIEEAIEVLINEGASKDKITVLHCNTEYPTPMEDVNLNAMNAIKEKIGVRVGYSDHTLGIEVPIAAVAMGAVLIEKHFTIDRTMEGPDHKASLEPEELISMVRSIRNIEIALGSRKKKASFSELKNKDIARKSIHLAFDLEAGHVLEENDLEMKRPGNGISPMKMDMVVGKKLKTSLKEETLLTWEDFE
nr:N-acetylneuraminate synthase family protein [Bacteroidota bacterium]